MSYNWENYNGGPNYNNNNINNLNNYNYPNQDILGSGTYGFVVKPAIPNKINDKNVKFPNNVTKIFYRKKNYNDLMKKTQKIKNVIGNNKGQRINSYKKQVTARNLSYDAYDELVKHNLYATRNKNLYAVHMPNLGLDVVSVLDNEYIKLHKFSFSHILQQIHKLFSQTYNLYKNQYIHADIRETNVMVNVNTGDFTIIDFDWFDSFDGFYNRYRNNFGFYNNPPECLLIDNLDNLIMLTLNVSEITEDKLKNSIINMNKFREYCNRLFRNFQDYWVEVEINEVHELEQKILKDLVNSAKYLFELADPDNPEYFIKNGNEIKFNKKKFVIDNILPYFDNFGLGLTISTLLSFVYVNYINDHLEDNKNSLVKTLQEGVYLKNYGNSKIIEADNELLVNKIADILFELDDILYTAITFNLEERNNPKEIVNEIATLINKYEEALEINRLSKLPKLNGGKKKRTIKNKKNNKRNKSKRNK